MANDKELGRYRLVPDKEKGDWVIYRENSARASGRYKTKKEAETALKVLEKNQDVGSVIHKKDGTIQKK